MAFFSISLVVAQEGFPLDGTWRGEWGPPAGDRNSVVMIMKWDGEKINGLVNPGRNSYHFTSARLEPETWTVHVEAVDKAGIPVIIAGRLDNIGSYRRTIEGTWTQTGVEYPFKMTRE